MNQRLWEFFHEAWGEDAAERDKPNNDYNKKAWIYVQAKLQKHEIEQTDRQTDR